MFMKNVAIAGGFLFLVAHGAGAYSLDSPFVMNSRAEVIQAFQDYQSGNF